MSFRLSVVSPEGPIYEGDVEEVEAPGAVSTFSILKDHAPIVSELDTGIFMIRGQGKQIEFSVQGGFVQALDNEVTALVEKVFYAKDIQIKAEEEKLRELANALTSSDEERDQREKSIRLCRANIRLANKG